jgi:hypothetical protein
MVKPFEGITNSFFSFFSNNSSPIRFGNFSSMFFRNCSHIYHQLKRPFSACLEVTVKLLTHTWGRMLAIKNPLPLSNLSITDSLKIASKYLILTFIIILSIGIYCMAGELPAPPPLPDESAVEQDYFQKIYANWNKLEVLEGSAATSNPDGLKKGKKGEVVLFINTDDSKVYLEVNIDGGIVWRGIELTNLP